MSASHDTINRYPPVSVVVRTYNEADHIGETLGALTSQDYAADVEILVVDSGSTDATVAIASQAGLQVRVLRYPKPYSHGGALNYGDAAARYELIVHLSADATPAHAHYLRALVEPLIEDQRLVATFGRDLPRPWATPSQARDLYTWFPDHPNIDPAERFSNANACLRRTACQRFPFDETLSGTEDLKWARQVLAQGARIRYVPQAATFHTHSSACRAISRRSFNERRARAMLVGEGDFTLLQALRFWGGLSVLDTCFAIKRGYPLRMWLHPWLFRACQAYGLYRGARSTRQDRRRKQCLPVC